MAWLISQKVDFIFYPALFYERDEFHEANNHYNCPIVTSYSENIKNNVDEICRGEVILRNPFMSFRSLQTVTSALTREFQELPVTEVMNAAEAAWDELARARQDMRDKEKKSCASWRRTTNGASSLPAGPTISTRRSTTGFRS